VSRRWAPLAIAVVAAAYFASFLGYGAFGEDEGLLLMQFARTARGELPYVDYHTGYPPATFYLNAALFRVFGESVLPVRALLVVVNAASVGMIFALARPLAGSVLAATAALGWAAYLPVFAGHFASFNIPYPTWYATCAFLAAQWAFDAHLVGRRSSSLVLAGVAAGVAFAFKQNTGALAMLACGIVLALVHAGRGDVDERRARVLLVLAAVFLLVGFTSAVSVLEACVVLGPVFVLLAGRVVWSRGLVPWGGRLWSAIARIAVAAMIPNLVWLAVFLPILGLGGIAREIFLVGSDFDLVYASPYPLPVGLPSVWPFAAALGLVAAAWLGRAVARGRLAAGRAIAVAAVMAAASFATLAWLARMPEGLARAVMLQVQHLGFYTLPMFTAWLGVVFLVRLRADGPIGMTTRRVLGALVFATALLAELYPRVDTTHLILAMPSGLVLAAWAAARLARLWAGILGTSRRVVTAAMAGAGVLLALAALVPSLAGIVSFDGGWPHRPPQVALESDRLPIHVEVERGEDIRAVNVLLDHLRRHVDPHEPIFAFPAAAMVPFALGLRTPTAHDYFFAGRPDHLEEAGIVRRLRDVAPRWVLTLNRRLYFFANAPNYYFILRDYVRRHYVLDARIGRYDVLRRRDVPGHLVERDDFGPEPDEARALEMLADVDVEWRRAGAEAIVGDATTPEEVSERAARIAPDEATRLLVLRGLGALGDPLAIPYLIDVFRTGTSRLRNEAGGALTFITLAILDRPYLLGGVRGPHEERVASVLAGLDGAWLREALATEWMRARVGVFAAWAATERGDTDVDPILEDIVVSEVKRPYLQISAAYGLARAGKPNALCAAVGMLGRFKHEIQDTFPTLLLSLVPTHPDLLARCLREGLGQPIALGREVTAWLAGQAGLTAVAPALETVASDPDRRVRIAAVWALGRLRHEPARALLVRDAAGDDDELRVFAREALARLDAPAGTDDDVSAARTAVR
jgi:hypothetical protein